MKTIITINSGHIILKKYKYKNIAETRRERLSNSKKIINENQTILKILLKDTIYFNDWNYWSSGSPQHT